VSDAGVGYVPHSLHLPSIRCATGIDKVLGDRTAVLGAGGDSGVLFATKGHPVERSFCVKRGLCKPQIMLFFI
jgi:hypothetical protein